MLSIYCIFSYYSQFMLDNFYFNSSSNHGEMILSGNIYCIAFMFWYYFPEYIYSNNFIQWIDNFFQTCMSECLISLGCHTRKVFHKFYPTKNVSSNVSQHSMLDTLFLFEFISDIQCWLK